MDVNFIGNVRSIVFESSLVVSEGHLKEVLKKLRHDCQVIFSEGSSPSILKILGDHGLEASKHVCLPVWGMNFDYSDVGKVKSLTLYNEFTAWTELNKFKDLESLKIESPRYVEGSLGLELLNLRIDGGTPDVISHILTEHVQLDLIKSMSLKVLPTNWLEFSTKLKVIEELEIDGTIMYLPNKKALRDLFYIKDIPETDFELLKLYPLRTLGFHPKDGQSNHHPSHYRELLISIPSLLNVIIGPNHFMLKKGEWVLQNEPLSVTENSMRFLNIWT
ncbi:uncharacterized protein J8A68_005320 [[Candida] subhashii]|uniref:Uncharacterized protein n=1 Tax=[Candida] subhashii TaxID=561895 RepID=A0A8J5QMH2_9ASCO|nr:uncharacterized protein J8A68_005320 [[Candida] subhashii]KAG7661165.1 hypothetical protein J8A68_005320 [[Candida] subhashii]